MSITLTYSSALSRVNVQADSLPAGTVQVQRSTNQLYWQTVRGAVAVETVAGEISVDDYEFAGDVENFYRVLSVEPPAGLLLPGASGDYASTPDAAALDVTGNIELRALIASADQWASGSSQTLINKFLGTGNQRSYRLQITATGGLQLAWSNNGTATLSANSTADVDSPTFPLAVRATMDVDDGAGNRVTRFYTASELAGQWTQLGSAVVTAGTTSIFAGTAPLHVGADGGGSTTFAGTIAAVQVWNGFEGFGGTQVANPDFAAQADGATSFADAAGRTWTVQGAATIVGAVVEQDSITPSLAGQVWLKSIRHPFLNQIVTVSDYEDVHRMARLGLIPISARSTPLAILDIRSSRSWTLYVKTETAAAALNLDLSLMSGDVWLLHVPTTTGNALLPGSQYVTVGDVSQHRIGGVSDWHLFGLPLTEVAAPGPDVVGGTMTYGALLNQFGGYNAVLAAHSAYAELMDLMASPDDIVVLP